MPDIYTAREMAKKRPKSTNKPDIPRRIQTEDIIKELKKNIPEKKAPLEIFLIAPRHEGFEIQEEQEKIILFLRPHWFTTLRWLFLTLVFLITPAIIKPILPAVFFDWGDKLVDAATILWYLFTLTYFLRNFLSWYYDVYFVTDERVVSIDFKNMMSKQISDTKIDRIQDISLSQKGFFQSTLDYGDVLIQTAAEKPLFTFKAVPSPKSVVEVVQKLILQEEAEFYQQVTTDREPKNA
ncbi:MAG: PH domain-containing protein [bacterium]|nr:PH domain-containing protein [bacterium]